MPPDNLKVWTAGDLGLAHSRPADDTVPVEWKKNQQSQATTLSASGGVLACIKMSGNNHVG